jgi:copper transport protein
MFFCLQAGRHVLALVLALLLGLASVGAAQAHAELLASDPAAGAIIVAAPSSIVLTFSEPVSVLVMDLVSPAGAAVPLGEIGVEGNAIAVPLPVLSDRGTYVLAYRIAASDGHPTGGTLQFSIGAPSDVAEATDIDWPLRAGIWLMRLLVYAGLFFGVGGAVFRAWIAPGSTTGRRLAEPLLMVGAIAAVLSLGLQGLDALGLPLAALATPATWAAGAGTSLSPAVLAAVLAMALGIGAESTRGNMARWLSAAALAGVGLSLAVTGHAGTADPQWLTRSAVFIHATTIALWTGALVPLGLLLRGGAPEALAALRRFSRIMPPAIAALILAGLTLAVIQLGSPAHLIDTAYGRVLLAKAALLAAVFALAAYNRWRLTPAVEADALAAPRLARAIVIEAALVLAVLCVVGLWRFTPPPRTLDLAAPPTHAHVEADQQE